jgi:adenosylcobinamide-phosphate synthase
MVLGSAITGADAGRAARIYIRDRYNHKSPNSGQTESVCAGALGLCLGGDNYYQGVLVRKPAIGDGIYEAAPEHIIAANRLMYATVICAVILLTAGGIVFAVLGGHGHV